MSDGMRSGYAERVHPNFQFGVQRIYWFSNGYGASVVNGQGASVVNGQGSYGHEQGLWEVAVIRRDPVFGAESTPFDVPYAICYTTPITDDVIGYCDVSKVNDILGRIEALPISGRLTNASR